MIVAKEAKQMVKNILIDLSYSHIVFTATVNQSLQAECVGELNQSKFSLQISNKISLVKKRK